MTVVAILFFCTFVVALTGVLVQHFVETMRAGRRREAVWSASARINDVTDQAMRRMLEEALRSMSAGQRMQGPMR